MRANGKKKNELTPKQQLFLANYTEPKSPTFGKARSSAINAGFSESYADNITVENPEWLQENLGKLGNLRKAEKVLKETLEYDTINEEGKIDTQLLKVKTDVAKFLAKTVGKDTYSERQEHTGRDGASITPVLVEIIHDKEKDDTNS